MNKKFFLLFAVMMFSLTRFAYAADAAVQSNNEAAAQAVAATEIAAEAQAAEAALAAENKAVEAVNAPVAEATAVVAAAETPSVIEPTENLEFVSGEVTGLDDAAKTLAVKLYGETENAAEKSITVKIDENTDITDGEKDRELKSLTNGTEVDVEYDPTSNKATYIFVY